MSVVCIAYEIPRAHSIYPKNYHTTHEHTHTKIPTELQRRKKGRKGREFTPNESYCYLVVYANNSVCWMCVLLNAKMCDWANSANQLKHWSCYVMLYPWNSVGKCNAVQHIITFTSEVATLDFFLAHADYGRIWKRKRKRIRIQYTYVYLWIWTEYVCVFVCARNAFETHMHKMYPTRTYKSIVHTSCVSVVQQRARMDVWCKRTQHSLTHTHTCIRYAKIPSTSYGMEYKCAMVSGAHVSK